MDLDELARDIKRWGNELGFQHVAITDASPGAHNDHLERWLERGFHGEMEYMSRHLALRREPSRLLSGTKRVISARMNYLPDRTQPLKILGDRRKAYVSRYALGRDYHKVVRRRLARLASRIEREAQNATVRAFSDSAPVLEKGFAEKAGLGWIGKHTLVLTREAGSFFFLGEIFTDLELPTDDAYPGDHCGSCTTCMDVCPTGAIVGPRELDARRCISYLTIELKGVVAEELRPLMGNRIFGCDDCQLRCPWNRFARPSAEGDFSPRQSLDDVTLLELLEWDESEFLERTEGSPIRRINFDQWRRNIVIALGNAEGANDILQALEGLRPSASPLVSVHLEWAIEEQKRKLA
jgi:epoxyqueuosine reductase